MSEGGFGKEKAEKYWEHDGKAKQVKYQAFDICAERSVFRKPLPLRVLDVTVNF